MQAVILVGGLGIRMRPATERVPKPMLPVAGKPFLDHQIELLKSHGVRQFVLLVGHLGKQIVDYFGDGSRIGIDITYSHEESPMGTGGALKNAERHLDSEFVLLNGDTYLDIRYAQLFEDYRAAGCKAMIVAFQNQDNRLLGNLALNADQKVVAYSKKNPVGLQQVDAGVIALDRQILELIPTGVKCSLEEEMYPVLIRAQEMRAWVTQQAFIDIGSPAGLEALEGKLA
jgi:mannose-1-phosphate guanylyltransferase